jgi:hypothetical protein
MSRIGNKSIIKANNSAKKVDPHLNAFMPFIYAQTALTLWSYFFNLRSERVTLKSPNSRTNQPDPSDFEEINSCCRSILAALQVNLFFTQSPKRWSF